MIFHAELVNISVQIFMLVAGILIFRLLIDKNILEIGYLRKDRKPIGKYVLFFSLASVIGLALSHTFVYFFDRASFLEVANGRLLGFGEFIESALMTGVLPGLAEETLYRGALISLFLYGLWKTDRNLGNKKMVLLIMISAFIFTLAHMNILFDPFQITYDIYQLITAMIMGSIEAYVFIKTRNLWGSILIHNIWNVLVLLAGQLIILFS
jgi:membrane protease YdiL (CAAX protease family)